MKTRLALLLTVGLALGRISPAAYAFCPDALLVVPSAGASVQIKGTHYDGTSATKVLCDSRLGDNMILWSCFTCSSPPSLSLEFGNVTPECQPLANIRNAFATGAVFGSEVQVVKNGVAKNQCAFHGATNAGTSSSFEYWYASTIKSFDAAGNLTTERGTLSFNTDDDRIFIGKITIKYPKP